jgi:putative transposase
MPRKRQSRSAEFKAKVALAAIEERKTLSQLSSQFKITSSQVQQWKKQLVERAPELFQDGRQRGKAKLEQLEVSELYEQIGRLNMELEWLKKKAAAFE